MVSDSIHSKRNILGSPGVSEAYRAGKLIRLKPGFKANAGSDLFKADLGPCSGGVPSAAIMEDSIETETPFHVYLDQGEEYAELQLDIRKPTTGFLCLSSSENGDCLKTFDLSLLLVGEHAIKLDAGELDREGLNLRVYLEDQLLVEKILQ